MTEVIGCFWPLMTAVRWQEPNSSSMVALRKSNVPGTFW